jgi:D-alanyl-lipoteichoic acid acyltransferase DltB (MBOAT superfamily)
MNYLAYCTYAPLYLAGPIVSFNDWISQVDSTNSGFSVMGTIMYGLRLAFTVLLMEFMLHYFYVVAIGKEKAWDDFTPFELSVFSYWNLKLIWMKVKCGWKKHD